MDESLDIIFLSMAILSFISLLAIPVHQVIRGFCSRKKFVQSDYWGSYHS